jgi:hypothetical protein
MLSSSKVVLERIGSFLRPSPAEQDWNPQYPMSFIKRQLVLQIQGVGSAIDRLHIRAMRSRGVPDLAPVLDSVIRHHRDQK